MEVQRLLDFLFLKIVVVIDFVQYPLRQFQLPSDVNTLILERHLHSIGVWLWLTSQIACDLRCRASGLDLVKVCTLVVVNGNDVLEHFRLLGEFFEKLIHLLVKFGVYTLKLTQESGDLVGAS